VELIVDALHGPPLEEQPIEVVERKGLGHPDTICDALAEELSRALSRAYLERAGRILHHNVDKVLLVGGSAEPRFGGGAVTAPIEIVFAGRAAREAGGAEIPVEKLAVEATRGWLRANLHALDAERHVRVDCRVRPGSAELVQVFGAALANDTSCGIGFAPRTPLERAVLAAERQLNAPATKRAHPELGEDVKVMGIRRRQSAELLVACAIVDRFVADLPAYARAREAAQTHALEAARAAAGAALDVSVRVNSADDLARGRVYLTVTGTSAEAGDDGEVGRGNRANGLITPLRPMTMEAAAGKNPVTHVGKIYNAIATRIAGELVERIEGVVEAHCCLVSRIGQPIAEPGLAALRLRLAPGLALAEVERRAAAIACEGIEAAGSFWREWLERPTPLY
jgi:S-adenosylmethionine synthetase